MCAGRGTPGCAPFVIRPTAFARPRPVPAVDPLSHFGVFKMVQHWVRYQHAGDTGFGTLDGDRIRVFAGSMFAEPTPTGNYIDAREARLLAPVLPGKAIALWNNFHALGK